MKNHENNLCRAVAYKLQVIIVIVFEVTKYMTLTFMKTSGSTYRTCKLFKKLLRHLFNKKYVKSVTFRNLFVFV